MKTFYANSLHALLLAVLLMGLCQTAGADTKPEGNTISFTATVNGAKLCFTGEQSYNGHYNAMLEGFAEDANFSGVLHIPGTVTYGGITYNIIRISSFAWSNNITGLIIDRISTIQGNAFAHCQNLAFVQINAFFHADDGYDYDNCGLYFHAFNDCPALTELRIPRRASLQYNQSPKEWPKFYRIDAQAFVGCNNLSSIVVSDNDPSLDDAFYTSDGVLYSNGGTTKKLVMYPPQKKSTSFTIPSKVNRLGAYAFLRNSYIQKVTVPDGIEELSQELFANCSSLKTVTLPNSIKIIGSSTFENCSSLQSVKLPYYLEHIYYQAFKNCNSLTSVTAKNPVAPYCDDTAFLGPESQIDLVVPRGSDYHLYDPWKRMKSITQSDDVLQKYGIRVLGTEVTEVNYKDVLNNGGKVRYDRNGGILTLNHFSISYSTGNVPAIENYGVDDLYITAVGECVITANNNYPLLLKKSTTIMGDTLTVSGLYGVVGWSSVMLANDVFLANATNQLFFVPDLTILGNCGFIGALGDNATVGYIGALTLGGGCSLVPWYSGHNLTYDSEAGTILDNGEEMAGGSYFSVGMPFPLYYCGIHLSTATNYLFKDMFQVVPGLDGGYILKGFLYGFTTDQPVLRSYQAGLELDLEGDSYVSSSGSPAIVIDGNAIFGGTGTLRVNSPDDAGIYVRLGSLYIENIDLEITGKTAGVKGLVKYGDTYVANLILSNVAGTIQATESGRPSIETFRTLTIEDCFVVNGANFNTATHSVDAGKIVLSREFPIPTAISKPSTAQPTEWYDLQGRRVATPQPGHIYIVRMADGTTRKMMAP